MVDLVGSQWNLIKEELIGWYGVLRDCLDFNKCRTLA